MGLSDELEIMAVWCHVVVSLTIENTQFSIKIFHQTNITSIIPTYGNLSLSPTTSLYVNSYHKLPMYIPWINCNTFILWPVRQWPNSFPMPVNLGVLRSACWGIARSIIQNRSRPSKLPRYHLNGLPRYSDWSERSDPHSEIARIWRRCRT
jgi:hypothetical protein